MLAPPTQTKDGLRGSTHSLNEPQGRTPQGTPSLQHKPRPPGTERRPPGDSKKRAKSKEEEAKDAAARRCLVVEQRILQVKHPRGKASTGTLGGGGTI